MRRELCTIRRALGQERVVQDYLSRRCQTFDALLLAHRVQLRSELTDDKCRAHALRLLVDALRGALNGVTHEDASPLLDPSFRETSSGSCAGS